MFCTKCGYEVPNQASFCPRCGAPLNQTDLVVQARNGDQMAMAALYEKTYNNVYYTVKAMIKDEDTVFDIVQDTYIKAFAHLDSFDEDDKFVPWVKQIAANTARDWFKKKKPLLFSELSTGEDTDIPPEEMFEEDRASYLPEQVIDQEETKRLVREMIEDLPEDQRAAIAMFYYEELSVKEIAAAMNTTESAVKSRLLYGRRKIEKKARELEKQGTKLYNLAPIPFFLLLLRNHKALAAETPSSVMFQNIVAGSAGHMAAGAGAAAAVKTAGGISAVKAAIIGITAMTVIGGGIFGTVKIIQHTETKKNRPENSSTVIVEGPEEEEKAEEKQEEQIVKEEAPVFTDSEIVVEGIEPSEPETSSSPESEETQVEEPEEDFKSEALAAYAEILAKAESYDFGSEAFPNGNYEYALEYMQNGDPVPTLLLCQMGIDYIDHVRIFYYDTESRTIIAPEEVLTKGVAQIGGYRGSLMMMGDGNGIEATSYAGMRGDVYTSRAVRSGDRLVITEEWSGTMNDENPYDDSLEIRWCERSDLSNFEREK